MDGSDASAVSDRFFHIVKNSTPTVNASEPIDLLGIQMISWNLR